MKKIYTLNTTEEFIEDYLPNWKQTIMMDGFVFAVPAYKNVALEINTFKVNPWILRQITKTELFEATSELLKIFPIDENNDSFHSVMAKTEFYRGKDGGLLKPHPLAITDYTLFEYGDFIYSFWLDLGGYGPCINTIYKKGTMGLMKPLRKVIKIKTSKKVA